MTIVKNIHVDWLFIMSSFRTTLRMTKNKKKAGFLSSDTACRGNVFLFGRGGEESELLHYERNWWLPCLGGFQSLWTVVSHVFFRDLS
jgi:hypothetical protein